MERHDPLSSASPEPAAASAPVPAPAKRTRKPRKPAAAAPSVATAPPAPVVAGLANVKDETLAFVYKGLANEAAPANLRDELAAFLAENPTKSWTAAMGPVVSRILARRLQSGRSAVMPNRPRITFTAAELAAAAAPPPAPTWIAPAIADAPEPAKPVSFKVGVKTSGDTDWVCNALRFATEHEANEYGKDLDFRWMVRKELKTLPSGDAVTVEWKAGRLVFLPDPEPAPSVIEVDFTPRATAPELSNPQPSATDSRIPLWRSRLLQFSHAGNLMVALFTI